MQPPTRAAEALAGACLALAAATMSPSAGAQSAPDRDPMLAETLFQSGKELLAAGDTAAACPKLAESQRLDPAGGTVLLLGLCYQQGKQWASAWVAFNDAVSMARKDGREDREKRAREQLTAVEARLSRLALRLDAATRALAGLVLRRDGREIPAAAWDTPLPIDPGPHTLEAQAPGHQPWRTSFTVPDERSSPIVAVPALEPTPLAPAPSSSPVASASAPPAVSALPPGEPARSPWHTAALITGGVGVVALGAGTYFGLHTMSLSRDANEACPTSACSDRGAVDKSRDAARDARLANLTLGLGAFAVGGAVLFYFVGRPGTSPPSTGQWRVTPDARLLPGGHAHANLSLEGSW